jgi:hypothetical protein
MTPLKLSKMFKPTVSPHAPADAPPPRAKNQKVTAEEIRDLRELMRQKYSLDLQVWNLRHSHARDKKFLDEKMQKADAALVKIRQTVLSWNSPDFFETKADYQRFISIRGTVMRSTIRIWMKNPPRKDE